jgi:hypothetical protein
MCVRHGAYSIWRQKKTGWDWDVPQLAEEVPHQELVDHVLGKQVVGVAPVARDVAVDYFGQPPLVRSVAIEAATFELAIATVAACTWILGVPPLIFSGFGGGYQIRISLSEWVEDRRTMVLKELLAGLVFKQVELRLGWSSAVWKVWPAVGRIGGISPLPLNSKLIREGATAMLELEDGAFVPAPRPWADRALWSIPLDRCDSLHRLATEDVVSAIKPTNTSMYWRRLLELIANSAPLEDGEQRAALPLCRLFGMVAAGEAPIGSSAAARAYLSNLVRVRGGLDMWMRTQVMVEHAFTPRNHVAGLLDDASKAALWRRHQAVVVLLGIKPHGCARAARAFLGVEECPYMADCTTAIAYKTISSPWNFGTQHYRRAISVGHPTAGAGR